MRRIIIVCALMLSASSPLGADPIVPGELFTPETVFLDISSPVFGNGTNAFCWQCGDASPSNDLRLELFGFGPLAVPGHPDFFAAESLGGITLSGPAESLEGLNVSFSFRVVTTVTTQVHTDDQNRPEELPRPSVAEGVIVGAVVGFPQRELELRYSGRVGGVTFLESSIDPFIVPLGGGTKFFTSEIHVDQQFPYTPGALTPSVTPEPGSLLLIGSGLAAVALKVRRARRHRS
jgi:hypothetical protein